MKNLNFSRIMIALVLVANLILIVALFKGINDKKKLNVEKSNYLTIINEFKTSNITELYFQGKYIENESLKNGLYLIIDENVCFECIRHIINPLHKENSDYPVSLLVSIKNQRNKFLFGKELLNYFNKIAFIENDILIEEMLNLNENYFIVVKENLIVKCFIPIKDKDYNMLQLNIMSGYLMSEL